MQGGTEDDGPLTAKTATTPLALPYQLTISAYYQRLVLCCLDLDSSTHIRPQFLLRQPQPIDQYFLCPLHCRLNSDRSWRSTLSTSWRLLFRMCRMEFKRVVIWVSGVR